MSPKKRSRRAAAGLAVVRENKFVDRDRKALSHEVKVYQEELIVQNEELRRAQAALEETRDRFIELYDFAPNGYLTLDPHGIVLQINLTGAAMLGRAKDRIEGTPLTVLIPDDNRSTFLHFMRRCRNARNSEVSTKITIQSADGLREVQLLCRPRSAATHWNTGYLASLVDLTDRNRTERERSRVAREYAALASRLLTVQEDERKRIARNLHDDIGQQVTALRLKLEALAMNNGDERLRVGVGQAQQMLDLMDRRLHFMATELRPSALDLGLLVAIEQFVHDWSGEFGIPAVFRSTGADEIRLPSDVETHVYRVVQEALNNVSKHASARHVSVLLQRKGTGMVVIVEDDGRGFDTAAGRNQEGRLGLVGMRERAQLIGGRLEIESARGHGTEVYLHLPKVAPQKEPI